MATGTSASRLHRARAALLEYRVPVCAAMMVFALASTFVLESQSASSFATYALALYALAAAPRWRALFLDWGFLGIVALLAYLTASSLWSMPWDGRAAFSEAVRALLVFAFIVSIAECMQVDWFRRRMTWVLGVVGAAAAAAAMWFYFSEPPDDNRLNGLGQLDTHVAAGMVYAMAAVCGLAWLANAGERRGARRWEACAMLLALAVLAAAVPLTGSRNAIACALLGAVGVLLAQRLESARAFVLTAAGIGSTLAAAGAAAYFWLPGAEAALLPRGDSFRIGIWSHYAEQWLADGLWFGHGALADDDAQVAGWPVLHPHNLYLAVAWKGGIVGLALLAAAIAGTLRTLLKAYARPEAKLALAIWMLALPGYLLDGHRLVDKIGWSWLLFWLPVAIGIGLRGRGALADARRFGGGG